MTKEGGSDEEYEEFILDDDSSDEMEGDSETSQFQNSFFIILKTPMVATLSGKTKKKSGENGGFWKKSHEKSGSLI